MSDFNSRYRNIDDQPDTIRTNASTFEYGGFSNDMDIMEAENAQKKKQVARASQARGGGSSRGRKAKRQMMIYGIIIALEVIALVVIWIMYFSYDKKSSGDSKKAKSKTESSESGSEDSGINVENDNFTLSCTKISITTDANGNPAALVYFTFVNKTDTPLSMSQVFAPGFKQSGIDLPSNATLADEPQEIGNKDAAVSSGQSIDCGYAVELQDTTSEITITMHDNYDTFSDIGTTVVPIS